MGISPSGFCVLINRDSTNFVEYRSATGSANDHVKMKAGEPAVFRFGSNVSAPYLIADTAPCDVEVLLFED